MNLRKSYPKTRSPLRCSSNRKNGVIFAAEEEMALVHRSQKLGGAHFHDVDVNLGSNIYNLQALTQEGIRNDIVVINDLEIASESTLDQCLRHAACRSVARQRRRQKVPCTLEAYCLCCKRSEAAPKQQRRTRDRCQACLSSYPLLISYRIKGCVLPTVRSAYDDPSNLRHMIVASTTGDGFPFRYPVYTV
ncbi:hypothetical protein TGMAS_273020 [Toxoplasma gondii MAS]|uniref:Uncharacterized protein n=1 Tax=Toxoplasma gondii MAS TaxID=943118 RepID=A0A086QWR1_TOXGO|nr:hypothetical protein TGMAS_273020 [Toxoplasma gondii MAS]